MTKTTTTSVLVAVSLLLVLTLVGATSSSTIHGNKHTLLVREECKDRAHVNCPLIAKDGDCGGHTREGEKYGSIVCPVSCGQCDDIQNDEISTDQICYPFGKQVIQVSFANSEPDDEDWVGIYESGADPYDLGSPVSWYWLCGDKRRKCKIGVGSITFPWLPPGSYKAIMARDRDAKGPYSTYGPYSSYAESGSFEVVRGDMCTSRRRTAVVAATAGEEDVVTKELTQTSISNSSRDDANNNLRGRRD